ELSSTLFERHGPRIALTPEGEILLELAQPLVDAFDKLDDEFRMRREHVDRGRVDIAAGGSTILYVLPPFVERFVHQYPKIELKLHNVTGRAGLELLRSGEVDCCIGPLLEIPDDLQFVPIVSYESMLITNKEHPLASKMRVTLADISR